MRKQLFRLTLFSLIWLSIPTIATAQVVFIPDFNLRAVIEEHLGKGPGATITVADMAWLTELDATNQNIRNLTGLETATNLIWLWLGQNSISDISPLAGLTKLTELELDNNFISNISPLARLTRLIYLNLLNNSISNISTVARLTNLTILDLGKNRISNISALAGLTNLKELWIDNNSISDLWSLVANTGLRGGDMVDVTGNPLSALSLNTHIPTLQSRGVTVEFDQIFVPTPTVNIPDPNLRHIIAQALGKAPSAIITAADMAWLTGLDATSQNISNITGLEAATNLTRLWLRNNSISNISPLAGLTKLTLLDLRDNFISNISALTRLTNLTVLGLARNNITNISPIAGLTNLAELGLGQNSITNISSLAGLTKLNILWVSDNSISDLWPLVANTGLRNGDTVNVKGNPLSTLSINTYIPTLQSRGVTVEFDQIFVPTPTVNIPDSNLRNAITQVLRKAPGATITVADMETLEALYATSENITNLTGLEHATNLLELGLVDNSISDLSPLAGLTQLTLLDLRDNFIPNISSLARLTNLTALGLGGNSISNIFPLAGLTRLTALNLRDNSISDISTLARLTNLTALRIDSNSISNISPLAGLTRLTELYLEDNFISDLWPLVANTGLGRGDTVDVTGNPLSLLSFNTHIPTLQSRGVTVEFDQIVVPTVNILDPNLRNAIAQALGKALGATITVTDMARLTELDATSKNITNLTGLETATNLTKLYLRYNSISNIFSLAGLTRLTVLILRDNSISDISPLAGLTNLTALGLGNNNITYVSPLRGLTNLRELGLGNNSITDISPLASLANLRELGLRNNSISNISPLAGLTNLTYLNLENNAIADLWPLVANTGLRNGDTVNVKGNPLSTVSINTHISTLQNRGVTVEFDQIVVPTANIPDPNLRNAIAQVLRKAQGAAITVADMETLAALYAPSENITNLTGLETATNLTELGLVDNNISNISPLARLTKLRLLWLDDNSISDISALAGLTKLTDLRLRNNSISDISPLVRNTGLGSGDWIDLKGNFLNNISLNTHIPTLQSRGIVVEFDEPVAPPKTVDIPSPNLRKAIAQALGKAPGATLTAADMATLGALHATNKNIINLTGLEHATNLTELVLADNNTSDLSPLAGLTQLTYLNLRGNRISNISPLARLTNLRTLRLARNDITDISSLAGLTQLTYLNLRNNSISDLSPLVRNTGLGSGDRIDVRENFLNNTSINTHIPTLQSRGVTVEFDQIFVSPKTVNIPDPNLRNAIAQALGKAPGAPITVADMETLVTLHANNKNITNLIGLETATNLIELNLRSNSISNLSPLVENTGLGSGDKVNVKGNPLSDLSINTHIPTLQSRGVTVEFDQIVVPTPTVNIPDSNLRNAIKQILGKTQGATITVADMETLETFDATNKNITNLTGLETATNLIELWLGENSISDISPLAGLTNLIILDLWKNNIADISALATLTNLTELWLATNLISDISPLVKLTKLKQLYLQENSISDILPLVENTGLGSGDKVNVKRNPLSNLSINTHIPTLKNRQVSVDFDQIFVPPKTVDIPDPNLRNAIAQALGKAPGATITVADMETLAAFHATNKNITNLTGLETATNLIELGLGNNSISDISPLAGLTRLSGLDLRDNLLSNISLLAGLPQLTYLNLEDNSISDISPLVANTRLGDGHEVYLKGNPLSAISINTHIPTLQSRQVIVEFDQIVVPPKTVNIPDSNLRNAIEQALDKAPGAGITVADMETLQVLYANNKSITNLTGLETATKLTVLDLRDNSISNLSPLAGLTNLTILRMARNNITDISPVARLIYLAELNFRSNSVSNLSPLVGLTNLTSLWLNSNSISDISLLSGLTQLTQLRLDDNSISDISPLAANPGLGNGDKVNVKGNPLSAMSINTHIPALQSRGVTVEFDSQLQVIPKKITGPWLWLIAPTDPGQGGANSNDVDSLAAASNGGVMEADIAANGAKEGDAVGNYMWTLGEIAETGRNNINDLINAIGIARGDVNHHSSYALITLESVTAQSNVTMRVGSDDSIKVWLNGEVVHNNPINRGAVDFQDQFTVNLKQGDNLLLVKVSERTGSWSMFVGVEAEVNAVYKRPSDTVVSADVNRDGVVNISDLVLVRSQFGKQGQNLTEDVSGDGIVDVLDLVLIIAAFDDAAAAPAAHPQGTLTAAEVEQWLTAANSLEINSPIVKRGIMVLEQLLRSLTPTETKLLPNYPNPFNPETWIPYRLAEDAFVTLTIYDGAGQVVRTLDVGHRIASAYENRSKAIYWDGRNEIGEPVASGVYFYHLSAGRSGLSVPHRSDYSATRKMLILK